MLTGLLLWSAGFCDGRAQALETADAIVALSSPQVEFGLKRDLVDFTSIVVEEAFNGVVMQGFASTDLTGWIRFEEEEGWGPWNTLYIVTSYTDPGFMGAYRGEAFRKSQRFELRFSTEATHFELLGAGIFDNRRDDDRRHFDFTPAPSANKTAAQYVIDTPRLHDREEWNAEPFRGTPEPLAPSGYRFMTFHHAAGFSASTLSEGREQVRRIQDFHQNGRGWSDIGYQFVLDRSGNLYQGRPFYRNDTAFADGPPLALGAHVGGSNTGNIGLCVLGCYHPPEGPNCEQTLPAAAQDSLVHAFAFFSERYGVPTASLRGHRDFASTACPGDNNYALLPEIRGRVDDALQFGDDLPEVFTLAESFPNPFRDATTIRYFLERTGIVRLKVYDVMGREIAILVDESQDGGRWYSVPLAADDLPSGIYYYRLQIEGFSGIDFEETKTLVHIR